MAGQCWASHWHQLGGDASRSGPVGHDIPEQPRVAWKRSLLAKSYAAPVVDGNIVYSVAGDQIVAWSTSEGKEIWRFVNSSVMSATPVIADGKIVIAGKDGVVRALNKKNGTLVWHCKTGGSVVAALLAEGESVYVGATDNFLYSISIASGVVRWRFEAPDYKYGGLYAPATYANGTVFFGTKNAWLYAVDSRSGIMRWRARVGSSVYDAPLIRGGRIYVGSYDRSVYALQESTGDVLWQSRLPDWPKGTGVVHEGKAVFACRNGMLMELNINTGAIERRMTVGEEIRHGLLLGDRGISVIGTVGGEVVTLDAERWRILKRVAVGSAVHAQPAVTDKGVFVTTLGDALIKLH